MEGQGEEEDEEDGKGQQEELDELARLVDEDGQRGRCEDGTDRAVSLRGGVEQARHAVVLQAACMGSVRVIYLRWLPCCPLLLLLSSSGPVQRCLDERDTKGRQTTMLRCLSTANRHIERRQTD